MWIDALKTKGNPPQFRVAHKKLKYCCDGVDDGSFLWESKQLRLLCRFVDLLTSTTSVEYVKLIVSCLDYSADDGLTRVVLQTALTSTNEVTFIHL